MEAISNNVKKTHRQIVVAPGGISSDRRQRHDAVELGTRPSEFHGLGRRYVGSLFGGTKSSLIDKHVKSDLPLDLDISWLRQRIYRLAAVTERMEM